MKEKEKYVDHRGTKFVVTAVKGELVYYVKQDVPDVEYHCLHEAFLDRFSLLDGE
jgi:hypothetical protein